MEKKIFSQNNKQLETAVLLLTFNRLDCTKKVLEEIRTVKPPRIYFASDGPRPNVIHEAEIVKEVRDYVTQNIDWECAVYTLFRDQNLGCKHAVSGAISWFFEHEEKGIILEDDCIPNKSFFQYCEELLDYYKLDESIYLISGDGRASESIGMKEDYGFCKYPLIWGWASWARVWKNYDVDLRDWPSEKKSIRTLIGDNKHTLKFWETTFEKVHNMEIDTWDYQLSFLLLKNKAKCIIPKVNLITNIGFGSDATHTRGLNPETYSISRKEINLPLNHVVNPKTEIDVNNFYDNTMFYSKPLLIRILMRFYNYTTQKK